MFRPSHNTYSDFKIILTFYMPHVDLLDINSL